MANTDSELGPPLLRTLGEDARHLRDELQRNGLKRTFERSFEELRDFYLSAGTRDHLLRMGRVRRAIYLVLWLLKSLFLKLTPARRLLLVLSAVLMWQSWPSPWATAASEAARGGAAQFPFLGIATLLLILMLELKDKLVAHDELAAGRSVQRGLMPDPSPRIPGWDVWLFTRSANEVGGDLVDYVPVNDRRFGLVLGDVAGKGLPAALLMAKLQATLRALADEDTPIVALGQKTNRILCRDGLPNRFATLVYLELSAQSGLVRVLNAGHPPPLVLRDTRLEELPTGAMALGMLPDATFSEQQVQLTAGDAIVAYSDGVTEAMNGHDEFFGEERLRARLPTLTAMTAQDIGTRIVQSVDEFVGDARPHDDLSLVVVRRTR